MFTAAALVPSPPLLVPQLSGGSHEAAEVRAAAIAAARELADTAPRWIAVGVDTDAEAAVVSRAGVGRGEVGTFSGFGADVRTWLDGDGLLDGQLQRTANPDLPLAALVAGWLREQAGSHVVVDMYLISASATADECRRLGVALREQLDDGDEPCGLLIVADGAATLTPKAPGSFDERAESVQLIIDAALAKGDRSALLSLDPVLCAELGVQGRAPWQVLAGVFSEQPTTVVGYSSAPLGVAYHVGMWRP